MEKWSFNMLLFSKLSEVLDISGAEIAKRCGMNQPVLNRYMNGEYVLPVQILLTICNALRMPSHYFVSECGEHHFPNRETATIPLDYWQPIVWDKQAVEMTFGDGEGRIFWKDVAVAMKVTPQKPHDRFLLRTRFPVDDFLHTCSELNISPFLFLVDKNHDTKRKATAPVASASGKAPDIAALTKRLDALSTAVSDITARYDDLLERHTALLDRHNQLENDFRDYTGQRQLDMAAEDKT